MTQKIVLTIYLVFVVITVSNACTLGVAIGNATTDGRPMLWKTRDFEVKPNIVNYTENKGHNFVSNVTPEYGFDQSWFGVNDKGFAIANTFISTFAKGDTGLGNGEIMNYALEHCTTVDDFIQLLDSTNSTGRKTRAVFGVIDAKGGAMIFEVNSNKYWKYNANNKKEAPHGFIIRSNFAVCQSGNAGIERYNRSVKLVSGFYKNNKLNVKSILQTQMRDIALSDNNSKSDEVYDCNKNICKYHSIAATVIQGVRPNEPAFLSTMWAMLGNPFSSVAIPYWAVGATPKISASDSDNSLFEISQNIKDYLFEYPDQKDLVNIEKVKDLLKAIFEIEDSVYLGTNEVLMRWRKQTPTKLEILELQKKYANYVYSELSKLNTTLNQTIE